MGTNDSILMTAPDQFNTINKNNWKFFADANIIPISQSSVFNG